MGKQFITVAVVIFPVAVGLMMVLLWLLIESSSKQIKPVIEYFKLKAEILINILKRRI